MVKDKTKTKAEKETVEEYFEEVEALPPSTRKTRTGKYTLIVSQIAKIPKKGTFKINLDRLDKPLKSVYPSLEKSLLSLAKLNGISLEKEERKVGERTYVSYPAFAKWKEANLRIRVRDKELYLEKNTEKALKT